jgi:hypothetical protein
MLVFSVLTSTLFAQAPANPPQNVTVESKLPDVASALKIEGGKFKGPGAAILQNAIAQSNYVLIGEDHMTREIPRFASAVCDAMGASGGFSAMAFEASPAAAKFIQESLGSSDRVAKMVDLQKRFPGSVAFLNIREENDLAAHCAAASQHSNFQIWGLDQDFIGSAGWIFDRMMATSPGPEARAAILHLQELERAGAEEARKTGDPSKLFMLSVSDADIAKASAAIEKDGTPATSKEFFELTESRMIYLENGSNSSESNRQRSLLMKKNFVDFYRAAGGNDKPQRVLLKFGDWHMYMGINPLHQRDLGNFVAEFADARKTNSLYILVLGAKGTHALFAGYDRPMRLEPFVMDQDDDYHWLKPGIDDQKPGAWTLYDLRQLRFKHLEMSEDWDRVVYGFDLLVIIPELSPAELIQ